MNGYRVLRPMGSGSSGDVFEVMHKATNRILVSKRVALQGLSREERSRVTNEVRILRSIDHPNIVKYEDSFVEDNYQYIMMERCEQSLDNLLNEQIEQSQYLPVSTLIEWMAEMLCAVQVLHQKGILHRDLKTANIFVSKKNHLKLGDFGVSKKMDRGEQHARTFVGTPYYMAPEVCTKEQYDAKTDIWSLGVVFYEMCTLSRPFDGQNLMAIVRSITEEPPPPFPEDLDNRFEDIVKAMLEKDPAERASAAFILSEHLVLPETHPSHPSRAPEESRRVQSYHGPVVSPGKVPNVPRPAAAPGATPSPKAAVGGDKLFESSSDDDSSPAPPQPAQRQTPQKKTVATKKVASKGSAPRVPESRPSVSPPPKVPDDHLNRLRRGTEGSDRKRVVRVADDPSSPLALHRTASQSTTFKARERSSSEFTPKEHAESMKRIKAAKSRIDISELRRQQRKSASPKAGAMGGSDQVFVPVFESRDYHVDPEEEASIIRHERVSPSNNQVFSPPQASPSEGGEAAEGDHQVLSSDSGSVVIAEGHYRRQIPQPQPSDEGIAMPLPTADDDRIAKKSAPSGDRRLQEIDSAEQVQEPSTQVQNDGFVVVKAPKQQPIAAPVPAEPTQQPAKQPDARRRGPVVSQVMELLASLGNDVSLEDLDDLSVALIEYKTKRFGYC